MINKFKKHRSILFRRLNGKSELQKTEQYQNLCLTRIIEAIVQVKKNDFSKEELASFQKCEAYRKNLLKETKLISYEVFNSSRQATIKEICSKAASPEVWSRFLHCLTKKLGAKKALEIGTNVGISGSYILEALKDVTDHRFVTMEGLPQLCELSAKQFSSIVPEENFQVVQGLYEHTFPKVLDAELSFDLMFIDGNHQKEPTLQYFHKLKEICAHKSVFIFDDINWSEPMREAWQLIKNDPEVNYSIDLYKQGIVIIDKEDKHRNKHFELHLAY